LEIQLPPACRTFNLSLLDAAEAALIRDVATNSTKPEMFDRLHQHLILLADEVERAMKSDKRE
jgi:hypothetical protein